MEEEKINLSIEEAGINFIRILWCDNANVIRSKAIHKDRLSHYFNTGVGICAAQQAIPVMYDVPVANSGLSPVGEIALVPDWETFKPLPYALGHGQVMGDMVKDGQSWSFCPRNFLKKMITTAASENLTIKGAFENEFYLLENSIDKLKPADNTVFASTLSMNLQQPVIDNIAKALLAQDLTIEQYYPESGPGQQEISILYQDALKAADQQIAFRETVRGVAIKHNLIASFLPKIFANSAGSGCHFHFSLWDGEHNLIPDTNQESKLSPIASQFTAGLLHHLAALMAITTPIPNSYRRLQPHFWSGAFCCWGFDNREAAIRIPSNFQPPSPTHIELKTVDASANPYLALGAIIAAGLDGINQALELPAPVTVDPGILSKSERKTQHIKRLPTNLGEALMFLKQDQVILNALGTDLAKAYIAVKETEWEVMKDWSLEQETEQLLQRF